MQDCEQTEGNECAIFLEASRKITEIQHEKMPELAKLNRSTSGDRSKATGNYKNKLRTLYLNLTGTLMNTSR